MSIMQEKTGHKVLQRLLQKQKTANKMVQCSQSEINQQIDDDMKNLLKTIQEQKLEMVQMGKDAAEGERQMKELIGRSAKLMADNRMYSGADASLREKLSVALDKVCKIDYEKGVCEDKIVALENEIQKLKVQIQKGESLIKSRASIHSR